jgi:hypothetical protein
MLKLLGLKGLSRVGSHTKLASWVRLPQRIQNPLKSTNNISLVGKGLVVYCGTSWLYSLNIVIGSPLKSARDPAGKMQLSVSGTRVGLI